VRVLFIVKKREGYGDYDCGYGGPCDYLGGLYNSAFFVVQMLQANGVVAQVVQVTDNNDIDREVTLFAPDVVIIEALWVVPQKFEVLTELHPRVTWVIRIHSEIPFLALEGVAVDWIAKYSTIDNVSLACNSPRATADVTQIVHDHFGASEVSYLPNWYPPTALNITKIPHGWLNVGCFGAIRPFKNQLIQALAAMEFAGNKGQALYFHINGTRCEQQGDSVLKNLRALFAGTNSTLVEHDWEDHDDFLQTIAQMDVSMTVSFSETFNIVSADAVVCSVPLVVSPEVSWASSLCYADTNDTSSIVSALGKVTSGHGKSQSVRANLQNLSKYDKTSVSTWINYLKNDA
jgi:hypothetical protein